MSRIAVAPPSLPDRSDQAASVDRPDAHGSGPTAATGAAAPTRPRLARRARWGAIAASLLLVAAAGTALAPAPPVAAQAIANRPAAGAAAPLSADAPLLTLDPAQARDIALVATDVDVAVEGGLARVHTRYTFRNLAGQSRRVQHGTPRADAGRQFATLAPDEELTVDLQQQAALVHERAGNRSRWRLVLPRPARATTDTLFALRGRIVSETAVTDLRSTHGARVSGLGSRVVEIEVIPGLTHELRDFRLEFTTPLTEDAHG